MKSIQRTFVPGSKWIYLKLYVGAKTSDKILSQNISTIIKKLNKRSLIEKWFFIRYSDPDFHIRIRLLVTDEWSIGKIIQYFHENLQYLVKHEIVWKIQLDTYKRELERYGITLIEEAESFFYRDSECAITLIQKLDKLNNENYRWMISLAMIDQFLTDFAFDLKAKQRLMDIMSNSFKNEFGFDEYNSKQLNSKFRDNKKNIVDIIEKTIKNDGFKKLYDPINKRSRNLKPIINEIKKGCNKHKIPIDALLVSYIHMMLNRLFRTKNRIHELVIYDFLNRYYNSKIAQEKYKGWN